jgi:hypothetical protein
MLPIPVLLALLFVLIQHVLADANNVCDWKDAEPIMYVEYHDDSCLPPNRLFPDGRCEPRIAGWLLGPNLCDSFCQIRTNYYYGPEAPLQDGYCHGPGRCTVSNTKRVGLSWKLKINPNLNIGSLKAGINGSFADDTAGYTQTVSRSVTLGQNECGCFTFIPVKRKPVVPERMPLCRTTGTNPAIAHSTSRRGQMCVLKTSNFGHARTGRVG